MCSSACPNPVTASRMSLQNFLLVTHQTCRNSWEQPVASSRSPRSCSEFRIIPCNPLEKMFTFTLYTAQCSSMIPGGHAWFLPGPQCHGLPCMVKEKAPRVKWPKMICTSIHGHHSWLAWEQKAADGAGSAVLFLLVIVKCMWCVGV